MKKLLFMLTNKFVSFAINRPSGTWLYGFQLKLVTIHPEGIE